MTSPLFAKLAPYRRGAVEIGQWYHGIDSDGVERWIGFDNIAGLEDHSYVRIRVREPGDASVQGVQSGMAWTMFEGMYRIRGEITDVEAAARALNKDARKRLGARA